MNKSPLVVERVLNAQFEKVWKAITDKDQMKAWYFDFAEFRPEVGFEFRFTGGTEEKSYLHLCIVTEVIENRKLSYSWSYPGYLGYSVVHFELFPEGDKTRIRLTHEGLDTFPAEEPNFARENFTAGWTEIIGENLKAFVEKS